MINNAHILNLECSNNKDSRTSSGGDAGIDFVSVVLIIYMIFCHVMQW